MAKMKFPNPKFFRAKDNVDWKAQGRNLQEVGGIIWDMLKETVNLKATDKSPSPVMAGATARAIFSGTAYPASLLEATMLRIRAERDITPGRAAILKAYYSKNFKRGMSEGGGFNCEP